jgi:hypothetical protein
MIISRKLLLLLLLLAAPASFACSPPPVCGLCAEPPQVPYQRPEYFAFVGKVLAHTRDDAGNPALSLLVLDAWTDRQTAGQTITIGVAQWQGCYLTKPMEEPFDPKIYPVGTRLRVISIRQTMYTWDVDFAFLILAKGT